MLQVKGLGDLADAVRARRRQLRLTQGDLARRAGVSRKWVSGLESGEANVQFRPVLAVCDVLELRLDVHADPGPPVGSEPMSNDELDDRIRELAESTSFGGQLARMGVTTVALDEAGNLVEYFPDGRCAPVG